MPDSRTQRRWLALAVVISFTVTIVVVSLHLRESHQAMPGPATRSASAAR